jgi:hypothetical protein
VEQQADYHQRQSSNLYTVVVFPSKEETANEQNSTKDYYDGSQIPFEVVHCYDVLFVFSLDAK